MEASKQKIIIVIISLIVLGLIGWAVWSALNQKSPEPSETKTQTGANGTSNTPDTPGQSGQNQDETIQDGIVPSNQTITNYLVQSQPSLVNSSTNAPIFSISSKQEPLPGWYVVTIRNNETTTSDASVVLRNVDGKLTTVAGPGTGLFNDTSLPPKVREALEQ